MTKITIVEDDQKLAKELQHLLSANDYKVSVLSNFYHVADQALATKPDLILLDINLPNLSGERILRKIRETSQTPIIMLTSRNTEADEIVSMNSGADDFISKPYSPQILLLRIEAILARTQSRTQITTYKDIEVHPDRSSMSAHGKETILTRNELIIFSLLIKNHGKIVSRTNIMDYLWNDGRFVDDNTLTVNITRLRRKLSNVGLSKLIQTRRAQGYILE